MDEGKSPLQKGDTRIETGGSPNSAEQALQRLVYVEKIRKV